MKLLLMKLGVATNALAVGLSSIMILLDARESFSLKAAVFAKVDGKVLS